MIDSAQDAPQLSKADDRGRAAGEKASLKKRSPSSQLHFSILLMEEFVIQPLG